MVCHGFVHRPGEYATPGQGVPELCQMDEGSSGQAGREEGLGGQAGGHVCW